MSEQLSPQIEENYFLELEQELDLDAAFQGAMNDVLSDEALRLEEQVEAMEAIILEANSELYYDLVDFQAMATQIEFYCNHNHELEHMLHENETMGSFLDENSSDNVTHDEDSKNDRRRQVRRKKSDIVTLTWLKIHLK